MTSPALVDLLDSAGFHSLSVVRSGDQWQANLQIESGNTFRIRHGATPSEAIAALFASSLNATDAYAGIDRAPSPFWRNSSFTPSLPPLPY